MELGSEYNLSLDALNIVEDNISTYLSDYLNVFYFDSGRSALKHLICHLDSFESVLLPEYICESVSDCFEKSNITFYSLKEDFSVDLDDIKGKIGNNKAIIFLMHYFGSLQPSNILEEIRSLADATNSVIIEDTTHSIFSCKQTIGDYMICSIRKWLPIPGGGVLYYKQNRCDIREPLYSKSIDNGRSYGMILKDIFIKKGFDCNSEYRDIFKESEERLDKQKECLLISDFAMFISSCISIKKIKEKRKQNYLYLKNEMEKRGIYPAVPLRSEEVPLVYPLRIHNNRNNLRSYLMHNHIYCAVHWPFDGFKSEDRHFAKRNAEELISLPIDQRYDEAHVQYMVDTLNQYGGDLLF